MIEPMLACPPPVMMAISLAASAAATAISYKGQKDHARAAREQQKARTRANNEAMLMEARSANIKAAQEAEARGQKQEAIRREATDTRSRAQLAMSESGATGLTFAQAMRNFDAEETSLIHTLRQEQERASGAHNRYLDHLYKRTEQGNLAINTPIQEPSAAGAALGFIGDNAMDAYKVGKKEGWWGQKKEE